MEKAKPIKEIFLGRIDGDDTYKLIYPPGFCGRCGTKLKKIATGWVCPNDGLHIQKKEESKNV